MAATLTRATARSGSPRMMRFVPHAPDRIVAVCECGCEPITLQPKDVIVFTPDVVKVSEAIRRALKLQTPIWSTQGGRAWPVGVRGAAKLPVFFHAPHDDAALVGELERMMAAVGGPFILLTPTETHHTATVETMQGRHAFLVVGLARWLDLSGPRVFTLREPIDAVWTAFDQRLAGGSGLVKTVERIDQNIEAVARNQYELRKENEELRQLNKEGYFNFAVRVNGDDFLAFAVIMALGNRNAAADHLKIPHRTFYNRVEQWRSRGKEYQLMLRYLEWRKRSSRHLKVELNPSLQSGESGDQPENPETMADVLTEIKAADNRDYPALLAEVLEALQRQNSGNWTMVRQELVEMIKDEV